MEPIRVRIADIKNQIYEAGICRSDENVILTVGNGALLERNTGKSYSYRMVDLTTLEVKPLFVRQKPLAETGYRQAIEKMLTLISGQEDDQPSSEWERAFNLLTYIFTDILPRHGMSFRENQVSLALAMLTAMKDRKIALCEAEVGTGKTHAYILAAMIYKLFNRSVSPIIISTSTIALQKAITEEYIPQISNILLEHHVIDQPLTFEVRKGKSHYVCDSKVKTYRSSITYNNRAEDEELLAILNDLYMGAGTIDLDKLPLTNYVKNRICVENCRRNCEMVENCRYRNFIHRAQTAGYDFQIANHNLVLADVLRRKDGGKGLIPEYGLLILDEAHKIMETAKQMYGMSLESMELERLAAMIYKAMGEHNPNKKEIIRLCETMLRQNSLLFEKIRGLGARSHDKDCMTVDFALVGIYELKALTTILGRLSVLFFRFDKDRSIFFEKLVRQIEQKQAKITILLEYSQSVCWLEVVSVSAYRICSLPKQLDFLLYEDIWKRDVPCVLTSGTLSVSGDFSRFKKQTGIGFLRLRRILEVSKASPFCYQDCALLYLPKNMPFPGVKDEIYLNAVVAQLIELIRQTNGHTLVLFTSYRMMEIVYQRLQEYIVEYPLLLMGRGKLNALEDFRKSGNGVLLASDSAGEGIDLPGDILSSLIVVRLPFPTPDPVLDYERTLYEHFQDYLADIILPTMLIKLRQWIGRGIRRETDTCVFSILDSRAEKRYREDILAALPDIPVTDCIGDVGRFIREKKSETYFKQKSHVSE